MKQSIIFALPVLAVVSLSGCSTVDQDNAVIGGTPGAIIGGVTTVNLKGAALGGAIGAGGAVLLGRIANGSSYCYYKRPRGGRYVARCR